MGTDSIESSKSEATSEGLQTATDKPLTSGDAKSGTDWPTFLQRLIVLLVASAFVIIVLIITNSAVALVGASVTALGAVVGAWKML